MVHTPQHDAKSNRPDECVPTGMLVQKIVPSDGHIYEVFWNSVNKDVHLVHCGPSWSPVTDRTTTYVGCASSKDGAVSKAEAAAYDILTGYDKYVMGTTLGKSHVISVHLYLEHLLVRCLHALIPNASALFRNRTVSFSLLISLCEAHNAFDSVLADVLRKVNAIRNKCAHNMVYNPSDSEVDPVYDALCSIQPPDSNEDKNDETDMWRYLCELIESKAKELGATDI